eukprot:scaffold4162_cov162-Amphora_coffeaeformis.AAC.4
MPAKPDAKATPTKAAASAAAATRKKPPSDDQVLQATMWEFTAGIPRRELKLMIAEADECEKALQEEIQLLEGALQQSDGELDPKVQALLDSPFTPMDRHWTLSALLGRLRGELSPPTLVSVQAGNPSPPPPVGGTMQTARALLDMRYNEAYRRQHPTPATLLPTWKKIFSHRLAVVFKKPVRDEDAPGYSARIRFPMDLSLVRKLIVSRHIKSLADLHTYIGLIAHNCVKYNGRETDYGIVSREFEQMADEVIRQTVLADSAKLPPPGAPASAVTTAGATTAAGTVAAEAKTADK